MTENYEELLAPVEPWDQGAPKINAPTVFGVRKNSQCFLPVPAIGERPLTFSAEGLPPGLSIDSETGVISGAAECDGLAVVTVSAENSLGTDSREIELQIGGRLALTPPMGWNSWSCWGPAIDAGKIQAGAEAVVASGLAAHGYSLVSIDTGWQGGRDPETHALQGNDGFPDMAGLCRSVHKLGLKIGTYSTPWVKSFSRGRGIGFPGGSTGSNSGVQSPLLIHIDEMKYVGETTYDVEDVRQWAEWGFDYLKYDWYINDVPTARRMHDALQEVGRDILYCLSNEAPFDEVEAWAELCNTWRTTCDIVDTWESISTIGFAQEKWRTHSGPGHWADPDALLVGQVGWGEGLRPTRLTLPEQMTHVTLWAMLSAPLIVSADPMQIDDLTLRLLCNDEVIAVDQDKFGKPAVCVRELRRTDPDGNLLGHGTVYAKQLVDGSLAVGLFNRSNTNACLDVTWDELGISGSQQIRNLWTRNPLGEFKRKFEADVPPHGVCFVRLRAVETGF